MNTTEFERLFNEHSPLVWSVIRAAGVPRADAADVFMQSWESIWASLPSFEGRARLTTWLVSIARKRCLDHLRRRRPGPAEDAEGVERIRLVASPRRALCRREALAPRLRLFAREARGSVREALRGLPPAQRRATELWMQGFAYQTIADVMNGSGTGPVDAAGVGTLLFRARDAIRGALARKGIRRLGDLL